jgi:mannose-1-phosphate guanylyltransferase/phosphomannomutase
MRAVIMAGGSGSRLRPLTCDLPKPMVPVLNRPVMDYTVDLLKKHGIEEIAVTLAYLPGAIKDYFEDGADFGISLQYFVEDTPLGTAGSVRNAAGFLPETFVVISGDALTDLDISKAVAFHKERGSLATLVLHRQQVPLEYGVVITDEEGRITRFLEKPSWGEVFSDTVNTGIYILEPEVLEYVAPGKQIDFSKDVFPKLLQDNKPMYGYVADCYWCDIGDLRSYRQAQFDVLEGKVAVELEGSQQQSGIWLEEDCQVADSAEIIPPVYMGKGCIIGSRARIGPFTVVNDYCRIEEGASLKKSVVWRDSHVSRGAEVRGATICDGVCIGPKARLFDDSVVGCRTVLEQGVTLRQGAKVWPDKRIAEDTVVSQNFIWGSRLSRRLFGRKDIKGRFNVEVTPEFATRLGSAYASLAAKDGSLVVAGDNTEAAALVADALSVGILACGTRVIRASGLVMPMVRFAVRHYKAQGGIHVRLDPLKPEQLHLEFVSASGANIDRNTERKLEKAINGDSFQRVGSDQVEITQRTDDIPRLYFVEMASKLRALGPGRKQARPLTVVLGAESELMSFLGGSFLSYIGCDVRRGENSLASVKGEVRKNNADMGVFLAADGEGILAVDERGMAVGLEVYKALSVSLALKVKGKSVIIPHDAPQALKNMAKGAEIIQVKSEPAEVMAAMLSRGSRDERAALQYLLNFDGIQAAARIADFLVSRKLRLSQVLKSLPDLHYRATAVPCQWTDKGRVLRQLVAQQQRRRMELYEGVKIWDDRGWALVLPDSEKPRFNIYAQGNSEEFADELAAEFSERVSSLLQSKHDE